MLLVGFGLLARSIVNIYGQAKGFEADRVLTMRVQLPDARFERQLLAGLRQIPEVSSAAITSHLPIGGSSLRPIEPDGCPLPNDGTPPLMPTLTVSSDYFRTFGIRLVAGREFSDDDGRPGRANVIVNQQFAAKYWPGQQPLGKVLKIDRERYTVVGISDNVRQNQASARELAPIAYLPTNAAPARRFLVALRTRFPPAPFPGLLET